MSPSSSSSAITNLNNQLIHAQAVSLARRWSIQNENDLMQCGCHYNLGHRRLTNNQEDFFDNTLDSKRPYDRSFCQDLASHLQHFKSLPEGCTKYSDIAADLKRRDSDTTHGSQYLG